MVQVSESQHKGSNGVASPPT